MLSETLQASDHVVAHARARAVEALVARRIATGTVDDAELVISELVTNAVVHGNAEDVSVEICDRGAVVEIVVSHRERGVDAHLAPLTVDARSTHGRGLAIVDVLADRWGVDHTGDGRRVWCWLPAVRSGLLGVDERDGALDRLRDRLAEATELTDTGVAVTEWAQRILGTAFAGIALPDDEPGHLRYLSVEPLPPASAAAWARFPVDTPAPVAAAFRDAHSYFHASGSAAVAQFPELGPALAASGMAALAHVPLLHRGRPMGVAAFAWSHGQELGSDDRRWLLHVAALAAAALVRVGARTPGP